MKKSLMVGKGFWPSVSMSGILTLLFLQLGSLFRVWADEIKKGVVFAVRNVALSKHEEKMERESVILNPGNQMLEQRKKRAEDFLVKKLLPAFDHQTDVDEETLTAWLRDYQSKYPVSGGDFEMSTVFYTALKQLSVYPASILETESPLPVELKKCLMVVELLGGLNLEKIDEEIKKRQ